MCNCVILLPFHVRVTAGGPEVYINTRIVLFISARCTTRAEFFPSFYPLFLSLSLTLSRAVLVSLHPLRIAHPLRPFRDRARIVLESEILSTVGIAVKRANHVYLIDGQI